MLICSLCGEQNNDGAEQCSGCGASLEGAVFIENDIDERTANSSDNAAAQDTIVQLIEYTCEWLKKRNAGVIRQDADDSYFPCAIHGRSSVMMNKRPIIIDKENITLGRTCGIADDYFADDEKMGDPQCRIYKVSGEWYIEAVSSTNPTCVDEIKLRANGVDAGKDLNVPKIKIKDGCWIQLADKLFKAEIKEKAPEEKIRYIIICPDCGHKYIVDNLNARMEECHECGSYDIEDMRPQEERYTV